MIELAALKQVVAEVMDLEAEELQEDTLLEELEDWDSVNAVRLMLHLESELGVRLQVEQVMKAKSLRDLLTGANGEAIHEAG
ncbi:acyl carrier protein [Paenibacillus senegalimassiliensis]|uniref:acyl carrier protein n=1 Tax=Paenibacillus senegalimassiliensis TaxID=1737426 RepID=UPI00073E8762|nr:acyl carrier protein [Paenibacillus senegalimassiliensis]